MILQEGNCMSRLVEVINEYKELGIPDQIDYDKLWRNTENLLRMIL